MGDAGRIRKNASSQPATNEGSQSTPATADTNAPAPTGSNSATSSPTASGSAGATTPAAPSTDGFDFGGSLGVSYNGLLGSSTPFGPTPTLNQGGVDFTGVWTRRGPGTVRSLDVNATGNLTGAVGGSTQPSGELNLGLNTTGYRFTLSAGSDKAARLPLMLRAGVEHRPFNLDADGNVRMGWNARLGYFHADEPATYREYNGTSAPPNIFAAGGSLNLTTEKSWGNLHLSTDHELGLDLFARYMPDGQFRTDFIYGHGTWFPIDTAAGIGGVYLKGSTALSYDINLGKGWLLRPMLTHEINADWSDPTIAPTLNQNDVAGGARLYTPFGLSASVAADVALQPTWDSNFAATPSGVATVDYSPTNALRLSAQTHFDGHGVQQVGGSVLFSPSSNVGVYAAGSYGPTAGTTLSAGISIGFGGPRREAVRRPETNPLTDNVDPRRPYVDRRGEDERYRPQSPDDPSAVAVSDLPQALQAHLSAAQRSSGQVSLDAALDAVPKDQPQLALQLLDTPQKLATAMGHSFPARGALPGHAAPEHPTQLDMSQWAAAVLRHDGVTAQVVNISVQDRPTTVVVYQDPQTHSWNALYNGAISQTRADSADKAVTRFCQGMGDGAVPRYVVKPPPDFRYGPSRDEATQLHDAVSTSWEGDPSALGDVSGLSYDQLVARVKALGAKDPEAAADAIMGLLGYNGPFQYAFHPNQPTKFSPEQFWQSRSGVCAEFHIFAARMMREAGIEAYPVELFSPGLAHVVTVYKDPATGKWNVADYDTRFNTEADSPQAAMAAYDPSYYKMVFLDDNGGMPANRAVFLSPEVRTMRDFMRRPR